MLLNDVQNGLIDTERLIRAGATQSKRCTPPACARIGGVGCSATYLQSRVAQRTTAQVGQLMGTRYLTAMAVGGGSCTLIPRSDVCSVRAWASAAKPKRPTLITVALARIVTTHANRQHIIINYICRRVQFTNEEQSASLSEHRTYAFKRVRLHTVFTASCGACYTDAMHVRATQHGEETTCYQS